MYGGSRLRLFVELPKLWMGLLDMATAIGSLSSFLQSNYALDTVRLIGGWSQGISPWIDGTDSVVDEYAGWPQDRFQKSNRMRLCKRSYP
jgi:hypothetical protein